jgi:hypothetical protein
MTTEATPADLALSQPAPSPDITTGPLSREAAEALKAELFANPEWAERYFKGDKAAMADKERIDFALAPPPAVVNQGDEHRQQMEQTLADFRGLGLRPEVIEEARQGAPVSQYEHDEVVGLKNRLFADQAWVARYMRGDREAARQMALMQIVLASPVRQSEQAA